MPFWSRQYWCWCLWASWCSNRTTRFSPGLYFLGRGPEAFSADVEAGSAQENATDAWTAAHSADGAIGMWVVGSFESGSARWCLNSKYGYFGYRPAPASKRMPPSTISTRPGQFAFSVNPAPGLRGSRVSRGTPEDVRFASLSRPRQIG